VSAVVGLGRRRQAVLSRRCLIALGGLQESVHQLRLQRADALRLVQASRHAATAQAQREFWLEFVWAHQEYRAAVSRLARFCLQYEGGSRRALRID
jgi:hypothetical protein